MLNFMLNIVEFCRYNYTFRLIYNVFGCKFCLIFYGI